MKIAFLLGSPDISGGTYVIFQHAIKCLDSGDTVTIITDEIVTDERIKWHKEAKKLSFINYKQAESENYDVVIATWWRTVYEMPRVKSSAYLYFVQSIESKFYQEEEAALKWLVDVTYMLPLNIITEATWIKEYLENNYSLNVILVRNGIRKDIYKLEGSTYKKPSNFRVLVEGPTNVFFKNVPKTIELVKKSEADELWLLTSSDIKDYPGVDRVFSKVPIEECAKIYRSCDVIVKLSYVEGMFGPPLEMFHCGGTAITYDVTGYDEYIVNGQNALVVKTDDEEAIVNSINKLKNDSVLLNKLKDNAKKTANKWIDWDESSAQFRNAIYELYNANNISQLELQQKAKFYFDTYVMLCRKEITIRKKIGNLMRKYVPFLYKIYRKFMK